jgi:DNA polymerase-3 subunit delta
MQVRPEQLAGHLEKGLAAAYLVYGEEMLVRQEAVDAIRTAARRRGYAEREVFDIDKDFDWSLVRDAANALSLFAERRILELRMPGGKPGDAGSRMLQGYLAQPPEDTLLLLVTGKLDVSQRRAKWVQVMERAGVSVAAWPIDAQRLPGWVQARMRACGLRPSPEAVALLAERVEGNLLACAQEIEKLRLLHGAGELDVAAVVASVADNARFGLFGLVDSALTGDGARTVRMLNGLRAEGIEPPLVVWALARELRSLEGMSRGVASGEAVNRVMERSRVWQSRQAVVGAALRRHRPAVWQDLLSHCARIDRVIKGQFQGNAWDELIQLSLQLAGLPLGLSRI